MTATATPALDVERLRKDFPILSQRVRGKPLVYLDNAATAQKPRAVIDAVTRFYAAENANIHRGVHYLSERATEAYDGVRRQVARFVNAGSPAEIVFTRGTTEGINLVAQSWARTNLRPGDEILITGMEHHSNIVPWHLVAAQTGAVVRAIPLTDAGELDLVAFDRLLGGRTRLLAVVHLSNALGTINPVRWMVSRARERGVVTLVDGAQSAPHLPVDVQAIDCDFFAFSGHKLFGPTGVGVLYGREALLESMPPWQGGGDMIETVTLERTTFAPPPARFEAGTPMIAQVIGLGAALDYLEAVGRAAIGHWEEELLGYATERIREVDGVRLIGTAREKASVLSFVVEGVHPHDVGAVLDDEGIAIRAGHHCAQPVMRHYGVPATARASFAFYNTRDEVDALVRGLARVRSVFA
jgi:cysteine desulfurase/selenocysteine lyase